MLIHLPKSLTDRKDGGKLRCKKEKNAKKGAEERRGLLDVSPLLLYGVRRDN